MRLLRQTISGTSPVCIVDTKGPKFPTDWSDDGRFITYNSQEPDYRYQHIWVTSPFPADQAHPLLQHPYHNGSARFAPVLSEDGPRWIAYTSQETGRSEIYIRSFPDPRHKWQISNAGGFLPQWRRDGRELFYLTPLGTLMAVAVNPEACEFGAPQELFATGLQQHTSSIWMNQYGVANDGQRFLLNRPAEGSSVAIAAVVPR
jgi:eukaryotic-like serine/threonine-protein kinase